MKKTFLLSILICLLFTSCGSFAKTKKLKKGFSVGNMAPEIIAYTINNKKLKLSSLRGQYVLIDFWASWCRPCRKENRHLVAAYKKFKNKKFKKGDKFTIYSFSLDTKKNRWKYAINKDKLTWKNHVSELKGWHSPTAVKYNIRSIPYNILIDGAGIIVAKNLRNKQLDLILNRHMVK